MKRIIKVTVTYDLDDPWLKGLQITPKEKVKEMVTKQMIEAFGWDEGYRGVKVEVIDTDTVSTDKDMHQIIKDLEDKVKRLEKSNRNWRRKCQRLRNESKWFSEMIKPEEHKRVIVRDEDGKEYRKPYYGAQAIDYTCRPHGSCEGYRSNWLY